MTHALPLWVAIPVAALLVISGFITLTGTIGLLRLPTFFSRIHAPTLGNTLGVFCVLVASILAASYIEQRIVVHPILITFFLVITSPVTAMLLMRAAIKRQARADLEKQLDSERAGAGHAARDSKS
ncbi:monovalent cation/H(+) antiporter subunit G [Parapusillimonas granuli]|uniref:Cation:proton antiporter n=1 Tax=Parapusillimonas granuli TaxID=380911 RepID=A0A853G3M6_9BURK|nr:monovalent cation/H(+) antiporter subunit G [Parapusillimonas granuli]MBB5217299.1 multicomponent K+:H+ antiporter subunit G [Parapusillimonas granuli]NYT50909.1 cation:proton antiporter [Parapusillimonas granuli]